MPTLVTFYALSDSNEASDTVALDSTQKLAKKADMLKAAEIAYDCVKKRVKTTVLCENQAQAEAFDEFIWAYPADKFIPHNLLGEGPEAGTPVEIMWQTAYENLNRPRNNALLLNLSQSYIEKYQNIKHIIDFVPSDELLKTAARERYKRYKQAGCQLEYKNL